MESPDSLDRLNNPKMEYYHHVYRDSHRWDNDSLAGKHVIVYMEQGIGDQLQYLRFIPYLDCQVTVHGHNSLGRIIKSFGVNFLDKADENIPNHDLHILSLSLPFILNLPKIPTDPYIAIPEKTDLPAGFNIGIAWEGRKDGDFDSQRNCPLIHFKQLPGNLICLQASINDTSLLQGCDDLDLYACELNDFYDTGKLINSVDVVVTVDTSVLHLAGAMGKKGYAMLSPNVSDPRWGLNWYPSLAMYKGNYEAVLKKITWLHNNRHIQQAT